MKLKVPDLSVSFGDGVAVLQRRSSSTKITANVLGRETVDGVTKVYLDRLVHRSGDVAEGWMIEGGVSTILVGSMHASQSEDGS